MNNAGAMNQVMAMVGTGDAMVAEQMKNVRIAMSKGKRFISLLHKVSAAIPERVYPVDGYIVRTVHNAMTKTNESIVTDKEGAEALFIPDSETGMRTAYILDTEFNRRFLASHLLENRWDIEDPTVHAQVTELAKTMEIVIDTSKMHQTVNSQTVVDKTAAIAKMSDEQIAKQIAEREKELAELKAAVAKPKAELPDKPDDVPDDAKAEAPEGPCAELYSDEVRKNVPGHIVSRAANMVMERNGSVIRDLKDRFGIGYKKAAEFRKKIQPQLDAELKKVMDDEQGVNEVRATDADHKGAASGTTV
jgi:hypothetical protein